MYRNVLPLRTLRIIRYSLQNVLYICKRNLELVPVDHDFGTTRALNFLCAVQKAVQFRSGRSLPRSRVGLSLYRHSLELQLYIVVTVCLCYNSPDVGR